MSTRLTALLAILVVCSAASATAADPSLEALEEQAFKQAAALVSPSIVRIQTVGGLDRVGQVLTGTGPTTGVAVSKDGYVISSAFNFINKPASILVELPDGRRLTATEVATDRSRMLTLLKVDAEDLIPAIPAEKDSLRVGQWSLALGRTFDSPEPSVSIGIVSALNRIWGKAIQTDAKTSPVNYGGPLVGVDGKVMGIIVPLSPQKGDETAGVEWYDGGIGFAIPMQDVLAAVERLKGGEDLKPGLMGIEFAGRDRLAGEPKIDRVRVDSPADKAGLEAGDLITEVDGQAVDRQAEVQQAIGSRYAGDKIAVAVKRGDETLKKELTLVAELVPYESGFLGILPERERIEGGEPVAGVGVRFVYPDSPAAEAGLKARDRITKFGGVEVNTAAALLEQVGRLRPSQKAKFEYVHGTETKSAEVELAAIPETVPADLQAAFIPPVDEEAPAADDDERPKTGRFTDTIPGGEHTYWAYVPEDYNPDYRYGLMVWLHPGNDTMEAEIFRHWRAHCDRRGILLLAPKAAKLSGWNLNEADVVKDAVEQFLEKYPVDKSRVFLHAHAEGGAFAYHLTFKYRELFRGVAVSSAPLLVQPQENHPEHRLQFHLTAGEKDPQQKLIKATAAGLKKLKYPVTYTEVPGRERKYPAEEQVEEIARWADALDCI